MKWGRQTVHCGNCGAALTMGQHWQNAMVHAPTCGKECNDALNLKYTRYILGKDEEPDNGGEKHAGEI